MKSTNQDDKFQIMADNAPVMIWIAGTDKLCYYFNKPWLNFTGRTLDQEYGNGWTEGLHPDDMKMCLDVYLTAFEKREAFRMQYRLKRRDGEYRWILDTGNPWFDGEEKFAGYAGSCIDISEMVESKRLLEKANQELLEFNYRLSHDLIAPIKTVRGLLELSSLSIKEEDWITLSQCHEKIASPIQKLETLIQSILELAKADYQDQNPQILDLSMILEDIKESHSQSLLTNHIQFITELEAKMVTTFLFRFKEILYNLISNSVKFYDSKKEKRWIKIATKYDIRNNLVITVSDNGVGFDAEYQERIFQMFFRAHSQQLLGNGLGLYLVKKHVEKIGGSIKVLSSREDTVFQIIIPNLSI